jgi:toxin ParE1/3/4
VTQKLIFPPHVIAELREIGEYIAKDNLQAALSFVERLRKRCIDAAEYPAIGQKRTELQAGLRSLTEGDYTIFYRSIGAGIEIVKIVHGKRNIAKLFKKKDKEFADS